jgi:hypothetical protein
VGTGALTNKGATTLSSKRLCLPAIAGALALDGLFPAPAYAAKRYGLTKTRSLQHDRRGNALNRRVELLRL